MEIYSLTPQDPEVATKDFQKILNGRKLHSCVVASGLAYDEKVLLLEFEGEVEGLEYEHSFEVGRMSTISIPRFYQYYSRTSNLPEASAFWLRVTNGKQL